MGRFLNFLPLAKFSQKSTKKLRYQGFCAISLNNGCYVVILLPGISWKGVPILDNPSIFGIFCCAVPTPNATITTSLHSHKSSLFSYFLLQITYIFSTPPFPTLPIFIFVPFIFIVILLLFYKTLYNFQYYLILLSLLYIIVIIIY